MWTEQYIATDIAKTLSGYAFPLYLPLYLNPLATIISLKTDPAH